MKLRQKWFEFEIGLHSGDTVRDKVPADNESEAREKIRRIYNNPRFISLRNQYVKDNLEKFMRQREKSPPPEFHPESAVKLKCPACEATIELPPPVINRLHKCPQCSSRFYVKRDEQGRFLFEINGQSTDTPMKLSTDPWEILGIAKTTDPAVLKRAYLQQIKRYHPDKVAALGPELIALAEKKTLEINEAYKQLRASM